MVFALLAERYERKSVITSNLVFSKWDQTSKDPMTTAAAIDRVVGHAVVLEFTGPSVRAEARPSNAQPSPSETPCRVAAWVAPTICRHRLCCGSGCIRSPGAPERA